MTLDEQHIMVERALGERMLNHAFIVLHMWLQELGFDAYGQRMETLENNYSILFDYYLAGSDGTERDEQLDKMTHDVYCLVDDVYRDMRLKRGMSPKMLGFAKDNAESVVNYFRNQVLLSDEDLDWVYEAASSQNGTICMMALVGLSMNLRDVFQEKVMQVLIDLIDADDCKVGDQALMAVMQLLIHYDVRIDFFPELQQQFAEKIGNGERAFELLCSLIRSIRIKFKDMLASGEITMDSLPEEMRDALGDGWDEDKLLNYASWMTNEEEQYLTGLVAILPGTWLYEVLVGEDEERAVKINRLYVSVGRLDLMWDNLESAENIVIEQLRSDKPLPQDYINYGHICFLRGDKVMAYENYREALKMLGSTRRFMEVFRPDRRILVDRGIPVEEVYLMEDQMLRV